MGGKRILKPQFLRGSDWDEFGRRFPDAYEFLWLLGTHNELQQMEDGAERDRRQELLWQLADLSGSKLRWDHRFL